MDKESNKEIKSTHFPSRLIQIHEIDKSINEQIVIINLNTITKISFINRRYETNKYGPNDWKQYNPPLVYIMINDNWSLTISCEEFEKFLKPFIENLNF